VMLEVHESNEVSTLGDTPINTMSQPLEKSIIKGKSLYHPPKPIGGGLHNPLTYEMVYITP